MTTPTTPARASLLRPADRLVALFPSGVVGFETSAKVPEATLHPEEAEFVKGAVEKRRHEFASGRLCARRALCEFGISDFPLLVGEKRFPIWPSEVVGSITHTRGYCAAVVADRRRFAGIGVDVEVRGRLERKLESHICTEDELDWLASLPASARTDMATAIFSAKEAFYKCQYCVTRQWLGFHDATLKIDGDRFEVLLQKPVAYFQARNEPILGRFTITHDHIFAAIACCTPSGAAADVARDAGSPR